MLKVITFYFCDILRSSMFGVAQGSWKNVVFSSQCKKPLDLLAQGYDVL